MAEHAANVAVELSQEERAKRREQKQKESAERKQKRAEHVAWRHRTDIIFLGRGVSKGLADRKSKVSRLETAGLPVYATPADLAQAMQLTIPRLRWLAFHADAAMVSHYIRFTIPKKSGGVRQLAAPHRDLAAAQEWILESILRKVPAHEAAHGFVTDRSTVTNAAPHVGHRIVLNTDLKDFFPTITFPRVRGAFQQFGYSPAAATIMALICTECPRRVVEFNGKTYHVATGPRALPQGACTSPALSNLISRRMDSRLAGIARKLGCTYTRYADDLTFSADGTLEDRIGYLLARIRHIAQDEGFTVNETKTRVQRPNVAQSVTGIIVNEKPNVPRHLVRRLRAILHHAGSEGLAAQNRENRPHFEAWVRGMIAYITMVNPNQAIPLAQALERLPGSGA
jgi:retron-type reverse transcriptase